MNETSRGVGDPPIGGFANPSSSTSLKLESASHCKYIVDNCLIMYQLKLFSITICILWWAMYGNVLLPFILAAITSATISSSSIPGDIGGITINHDPHHTSLHQHQG